MVRVKQQLSRNRNHGGSGNRMDYITVHQTANTSRGANAQAHANLIDNGFTATWHYTVDDTQAIQSFYESTRCFHAGDGTGPGNYSSIGIEICVNSDGDYNKAVNNAVELIKDIMRRRNIPLSRVVTHGHWTGKHCPREILNGKNGITWTVFKNRIAGSGGNTSTPAPKKSAPKQSSGSKSISTMATEVINGQHGSGHSNRQRSLGVNNATYQKVRAEVNRRAGVSTPSSSGSSGGSGKSVNQMATEVINGQHGSGHANRRRSLGVNNATYQKVRAEVNRRAGGGSTSSGGGGKSIGQMASEVLAGKHGNGHANRQRSLGVNNATYQKVRAEVNRRS